jgi:hypothetical protein
MAANLNMAGDRWPPEKLLLLNSSLENQKLGNSR